MPDAFAPRSADDYAQGFANLLPRGAAWPRETDSVLMRLVRGMADIWGVRVDTSAAALLEIESDPRKTVMLLAEWERAFGLPDECVPPGQSVAARQAALVAKMTMQGAQSRAFFIAVAQALGYEIVIDEFAPFMCGVSECGDTRALDDWREHYRWEIGAPEMRFYWRVRVLDARLTWFRVGTSQVGVDPHLSIDLPDALECLLRRWKPAHTEIGFAYAVAGGLLDPMAGTP